MLKRLMFGSLAVAMMLVASVGGVALATSHAPAGAGCNERLLTFPAWYRGLLNSECDLERPGSSTMDLKKYIWTIVLNIVEMGLQLVGYAAVAFMLYGGTRLITSAGSPGGIASARTTLMNAAIGLVISLFSIAIVNTVAGVL